MRKENKLSLYEESSRFFMEVIKQVLNLVFGLSASITLCLKNVEKDRTYHNPQ